MAGGHTALAGQTMYLSAGTLADWYETARPGQWVAYAIGPALDPREPVVATVKSWIEGRTARSNVQRIDGALHHRVTRVAALTSEPDAPRRKPLSEGLAASAEGQLFLFIDRLTMGGLPMPSNAEIARALGWRDRDQVAYRLKRLIEMDLVRVPAVGRFSTRIVTVTETGMRTADCAAPMARVRA